MILLDNVLVYTNSKRFEQGQILIDQEDIVDVRTGDTVSQGTEMLRLKADRIIDGHGMYAVPGFIDIHLHGCHGYDFCDGNIAALQNIAEYELSIGVTSFMPATMTLPLDELFPVLETARDFQKTQDNLRRNGSMQISSSLLGINMEGPFISPQKCGAQNAEYILSPDVDLWRRFQSVSNGLVKVIGVAPEAEGIDVFIRSAAKESIVSIAHSNADYNEALNAFQFGASHVTHLYNAMSGHLHRSPGIVGAAFDQKEVTVELICDGVHIHPSVVRSTFQMFGSDRIIMISDSMRATGLGAGRYTLGGQKVEVKANCATIVKDGSLAGSVTSLAECVRIAVKEMKIPLEDVIACVTCNPAKRLGIYHQLGSIEKGKKADILLLDSNIRVCKIMKHGVIVK